MKQLICKNCGHGIRKDRQEHISEFGINRICFLCDCTNPEPKEVKQNVEKTLLQ